MATATVDLDRIKTWRDANEAGLPCFKIFSDGVVKAFLDETGTRRFELVASSDGTDLVGDAMTEKALAKMKSAAPGTTMFLNHQYSVPEDVFGAVESADLVEKVEKDVDTGKATEMTLLVYKGAVEETNERAVRVHEMMMAGRVKLGASISVLITDKSTAKDGRRLIDDVYYLECSVVGMPCNRQSWVQSATKAANPELFDKPRKDEKAMPATSMTPAKPLTLAKMTEQFPFLGAAAKRVIDRTKAGGFFQDEFEECTGNIYFLTSVLCNACFDLYMQANMGTISKDDVVGTLQEGLSEFSEMVIACLGPELEQMAEEAENSDYLDEVGFYGLHDPQRLLLAAAMLIQRAGARHSKQDLEAIQGIHDATASLGANCKAADDDPDDEPDDDPDDEEDKQLIAFADGERSIDGWIVRAVLAVDPDFATSAISQSFERFMLAFADGLAKNIYVRKDDDGIDALDRHADGDQKAIKSIHKSIHSVHKALADLEVQCDKAASDNDHLDKIHKAVHTAHNKAVILGMGCKGFGTADSDTDDDAEDKAALASLADAEVVARLAASEIEAVDLTEKLLKANLELNELDQVKQQQATEIETLKKELADWEAYGDQVVAQLKAYGREPMPRQS